MTKHHHRTLALVCTLLMGLIATASTATAKTERRFETGSCGDGTAWWTVTVYVDGRPCEIEGVDCDGKPFGFFPLWCPTVSSNPIAGMTPTHTGSCDAGATVTSWSSVLQYNADHQPIWMGGQACDGTYWVVTTFGDGSGGGGIQ